MACRDPRYGAQHDLLRQRFAAVVNAGQASCARCGKPIIPGTKWHLDHRDGGRGYLGPSHAICNLVAAGRRRWPRPRAPELAPARGWFGEPMEPSPSAPPASFGGWFGPAAPACPRCRDRPKDCNC